MSLPPSHPMTGAWTKYKRARLHRTEFNDAVVAWLTHEPARVILGEAVPPERARPVLRDSEAFPIEWSAIIGDVAQGMRSVLEHAAYAAATRFEENPGAAVEFPVKLTENDWRKYEKGRGRRVRQLVGDDAWQVIESVQPFRFSVPNQIHPFEILHDLARIDRHRDLHLTAVHVTGMSLMTPSDVPFPVKGNVLPRIEDLRKVHFVTPSVQQSAPIVVTENGRTWNEYGYSNEEFDIAFDHTSVFPSLRVMPALEEIERSVKMYVLQPFFALFAV